MPPRLRWTHVQPPFGHFFFVLTRAALGRRPLATGSGLCLGSLHSPRLLSLSPLVMHPRPQTLVAP